MFYSFSPIVEISKFGLVDEGFSLLGSKAQIINPGA
jgi:hypothetical protein